MTSEHAVRVSSGIFFSKLICAAKHRLIKVRIFSFALDFVNPEENEPRRCPDTLDGSDSAG